MITWKSALVKHCDSIEALIDNEKQRLQSTKEQLIQLEKANSLIDREKKELKEKDEKIRLYKMEVQSLTNGYVKIREGINQMENRKVDQRLVDSKKRSLKVVLAEIESLNIEIEKLDKKLREMREINVNIEKNNQKKLQEFHVNHGFISKPRSSGCLQLGQLMMEQEDTKQALNLVIAKKTRLQYIIRELHKNLTVAENEYKCKEENIRRKESSEVERNLTLIENTYKSHKQFNDKLEQSIQKAREKLRLIELKKEQLQFNGFDVVRMKIEEDEAAAEKCKDNVAELSSMATKIYEELIEMKKQKTEFEESSLKNYEDAMRCLNAEISQLKSENADLDGKIEYILKSNNWMKKFEKNVVQEQENEENSAERLLRQLRAEEGDEKLNLQKLKETLKKTKEHIEHLLDILFNAQLQSFTKERFLEELSNGLWEIKKVYGLVLKKKSEENNCFLFDAAAPKFAMRN